MLNRILIAISLTLFIFQLAFSIVYSNIIVNINSQYQTINKKYQNLSNLNQDLEINYAIKYAIH